MKLDLRMAPDVVLLLPNQSQSNAQIKRLNASLTRLRLLTALHRVAPSFQLLTEHLVSAGLRLCLRILVAKHRLLSR
jgi:hypothetical protein